MPGILRFDLRPDATALANRIGSTVSSTRSRWGLPEAGLPTSRYSAASVMLSRGVPFKVVSEILGHSSITITGSMCGHVAPDVFRHAMTLLGEALDG